MRLIGWKGFGIDQWFPHSTGRFFSEEEEKDGVQINTDLNSIFDNILMQKVLPRIEGDYEKCDACLVKLATRADKNNWNQSLEKIEFMIERFGKDHSGFTSFWN